MQFWGNQCLHYTVPNDTPFSRLAIDFRVIPLQHYMEHYPSSHSQRNGQPRFGKGAYFAVMTPGAGREGGAGGDGDWAGGTRDHFHNWHHIRRAPCSPRQQCSVQLHNSMSFALEPVCCHKRRSTEQSARGPGGGLEIQCCLIESL